MRPSAVIFVVLAVVALVALPGRAAEESAEEMATETCGGPDCATSVALATASAEPPALAPRLDERTRDLLVVAALVCLLLASLLLNARAFGQAKPRRRPARAVSERTGPARAPEDSHTPVAP